LLLQKINDLISSIFWKSEYEHPSLIKIFHNVSKPFENVVPNFEDEEINKGFENDNKKWYHNEYIYKIHGVIIEPTNKICIKGFRTIIKETQAKGEDKPSLIKYLIFMLSFKKAVKIEEAIFFDGNTGRNYFHFFSDVMNTFWLSDSHIQNKKLPLIISRHTYSTTYFQYLLNNTQLKGLNWYVHDNESWLKINVLWYNKSFSYKKDNWLKTIQLLDLNYHDTKERIFINRSKKSGRCITNMDELLFILKKYNFTIVDTAEKTFKEQISIFSKAEVVIGIHGAGNTNIIFSDLSKVKFIEILPANRISCHYYWLSETLGIDYTVIKGESLDSNGGFKLAPHLLETAIKNKI